MHTDTYIYSVSLNTHMAQTLQALSAWDVFFQRVASAIPFPNIPELLRLTREEPFCGKEEKDVKGQRFISHLHNANASIKPAANEPIL